MPRSGAEREKKMEIVLIKTNNKMYTGKLKYKLLELETINK